MDEGMDFREDEERGTKAKDNKTHPLNVEERDEIIHRYNVEHSIHTLADEETDRTEQSDVRVGDSEDSSDASESTDPMERLAHLLVELVEVGNIAVSKNMRFLNRAELDALLSAGQKFLGGWKSSIVSERPTEASDMGETSETGDTGDE